MKMVLFLGKTSGKHVGIPIPKFTVIPSSTYWAALLAILYLTAAL
jgi:hypothetical protein